MKIQLIKPQVKEIKEKDPFKKIEICGRNCYKSVSPITEETSYDFFMRMLKNKHYAMLEHATFVFEITGEGAESKDFERLVYKFGKGYLKYTNEDIGFYKSRVLVSGNLRAILGSSISPLIDALVRKYEKLNSAVLLPHKCWLSPEKISAEIVNLDEYSSLSEIEVKRHKYNTYLFTTDRGVTHEMVRHRPVSFAQESTRYCNYAKSDTMQFIEPPDFDSWDNSVKLAYKEALKFSADTYEHLISGCDFTAQKARGVLPVDLKSDIVMTTNFEEWKHFFDLRFFGTTGAPHPNMKQVAEMAYNLWHKEYEDIYLPLIKW